MKLLFDICHPAEVHHFRHLYHALRRRGWAGLFAARDKDVTRQLLTAFDLPHIIWSASRPSLLKKTAAVPHDLSAFYRIVRTFKPHVIMSTASVHSSWIAAVLPITLIACLDTEHRITLDRLTLPFVNIKFASVSYQRPLSGVTVRYPGTHESAYLHPHRFKPDPAVLDELQVGSGEYVLVRFVAWKAFHDRRGYGMTRQQQIELVVQILKQKKVFICSEGKLPPELQPYRFPLAAHKLHDALAFAHACVSEGATTAAEAVNVGTPAMLISPFRLGYIDDAAKYGLLTQTQAGDIEQKHLEAFLQTPGKAYQDAFHKYQRDHIDSTLFMEQYLLSMRENDN